MRGGHAFCKTVFFIHLVSAMLCVGGAALKGRAFAPLKGPEGGEGASSFSFMVPEKKYEKTSGVYLRILDKITGRVVERYVGLEAPFFFKTLRVKVRACYENCLEDKPEKLAYLLIQEKTPQGMVRVFRGWMFASNPSLCVFEHPIYDLWVVAGPS